MRTIRRISIHKDLPSQPSLKKQFVVKTGDWCAVTSMYDVFWRHFSILPRSAAGQFLGYKTAERQMEREDRQISDFAYSSQGSGHNQDVETIDDLSGRVVEGKLLEFSLLNKVRIVIRLSTVAI